MLGNTDTILVESEEKGQGIIIGRSECQGANIYWSEEEERNIAIFEIIAFWSKAFEDLVKLVDDPKTEDHIYSMLEDQLIEETQGYLGGLSSLMDYANVEKKPLGNVSLSIVCILDENSNIDIMIESSLEEFSQVFDEPYRNRFLVQCEGLELMYRKHYSIPFRQFWEDFIDTIFHAPERCREYFTED